MQSFKYKPKKRTASSGSNQGTHFPISPPNSNSSGDRDSPDALGTEDDIAAEEELNARDDSLGSLEDLDLLDVGAIDDNGMQDIIEEVMTTVIIAVAMTELLTVADDGAIDRDQKRLQCW